MTVATAIYQNIYSRYLAPGECIVHDRGKEFCNEVHNNLHSAFNVNVRIISAFRPRGNGAVESRVKVIKEKMRALMSESGGGLPKNWDQTLLYKVLSIVRMDPSRATGFAPAELLLGRPVVYPIEIEKKDIDFSGTELTVSVVEALNSIHNTQFGKAAENINAYQEKYKAAYDARMKVRKSDIIVGSKVQLLKRPRKKNSLKWTPINGYYEVVSFGDRKMTAMLRNPITKYEFKKSKSVKNLRLYRGK